MPHSVSLVSSSSGVNIGFMPLSRWTGIPSSTSFCDVAGHPPLFGNFFCSSALLRRIREDPHGHLHPPFGITIGLAEQLGSGEDVSESRVNNIQLITDSETKSALESVTAWELHQAFNKWESNKKT
ncbi:Hypothetical predicted protein [Pelobates cultripes]|uniref:Uncharacterized protein n=1 Tax=Pelobates cultripes TaxID=61616 RepID=A0AAD1RNT3_PELCU|nr:Hypothetical predicted protein [Pelobates cultripes]